MKEQEPVNFELTNQPNLHTLKGERNFMPEPAGPEIAPVLAVNPLDNPPVELPRTPYEFDETDLRDIAENHRRHAPPDRKVVVEGAGGERLEVPANVGEFQSTFGEGVRTIMYGQSLDDENVSKEFDEFLYYAEKTKKLSEEVYNRRYKSTIDDLKKLREEGNYDRIKEILPDFAKAIRGHYLTPEAVVDIPESLEDLAFIIMRSESAQWRTGGKRELLDHEGNVNKENFLAWARKRMLEVHDFNSTSTVDFFSQITVKYHWTVVSLYDMVLTGSYFSRKRSDVVLIPKPKNGEEEEEGETSQVDSIVRKNLHADKDYEKLREELLYEAWLFNTSRNNHVEYVANQFSEKDLSQTINKIYTPNIFTRGNYLELIMSMPSMRKRVTELRDGHEIEDRLGKDFTVGQATRKLLLAYYYIFDPTMLQKIFGRKDIALFTKTYDDIDPDTGDKNGVGTKVGVNKKGETEPVRDKEKKIIPNKNDRDDWYKDGMLRFDDDEVMEEYKQFINVFTAPGPQKSEAIIAEVRERMIQSIMTTMGMDYDEAKYAEAWAFSMTRWTGLGAKNDTGAVGHDAWTKALNAQEYRIRQMAEQRNATYGNIFNMLGFKRLGLNFFEGIKDENGRTIIEVLQGGQGSDITDLEKAIKKLDAKVRFAQDTMRGFAGNHILNSFALVEFLIDHNELNFQEMLTFDGMGRPIINYEKANKIIDGIEKTVRYWCSTWGGTDYSKTVRTWEIETEETPDPDYISGNRSRNKAVAKDMPILMELFGPEILKIMKRQSDELMDSDLSLRTEDGKRNYMKSVRADSRVWNVPGVGEIDTAFLQSTHFRHLLWKGMFEYLVKSEIEAHRNVYSDEERFNMLKMERIYAFLREKHILTDDEIKRLRKETHTTELGLLLTEGGSGALLGALLGALKGFGSTTGKLTKV